MVKIEKLTPQQELDLVAWRERWLKVGLATGPVDRKAAELAVADVYRERGLTPPNKVLWARSPCEGLSMAAALSQKPANQLRDQLWDQLGDQLGDQLRGQLRDQLWDQLWDQLGGQLRGQLGGQLDNFAFGQHDVYWLATYEFMRQIGAVSKAVPEPMLRLAENCGWWLPYSNVAICCERPVSLHRDERGRLHRTNGLAIEFSDGWGIAAVRGTRVPDEWVTQPLDAKVVLSERNAEKRMAAATIVGWDKVLTALDAKLLDRHENPMFGELWQADMPDAPKQKFLKARCGTGRTVVVLASSKARTALEAGAMSYGVTPDAYAKLKERH